MLLAQDAGGRDRAELAAAFIDPAKGVLDAEAAYAGARDIVAETVAETASVRQAVREATRRTGLLRVARKEAAADAEGKYQLYYEFGESLANCPPHHILAISSGEREGVLKADVEANHDAFIGTLQRRYAHGRGFVADEVRAAVADGYKRLQPGDRARSTRRAERARRAARADGVRGQPARPAAPAATARPRGDGPRPGYRTGCKVAVVDATGKYLESGVVYLHQPERARQTLLQIVRRYGVQVIAIGNGTASRETEALVADVIRVQGGIKYVLVSEAGASVYSASDIAREEFRIFDATQRGNVSIARRLQDPLAELEVYWIQRPIRA